MILDWGREYINHAYQYVGACGRIREPLPMFHVSFSAFSLLFLGNLSHPQSSLQSVAVRVVGCGFTLADLVFQRISAVTSCLGDDLASDVTTLGFGRSVPELCNEDEVRYGI